jgi:hypothetical protein
MRALIAIGALLGALAVSTAHEHTLETALSGANEDLPNLSLGTGTSTVTLDLDLITMRVQVDFSSLSGTVTAATIHGPTPTAGSGAAAPMSPALTLSGFPAGVSAGIYDFTFDLTVATGYDPAFIVSSGGTVSDALNALIASFEDGKSYINIRTTAFPTGEVRGFFVETPEPATVSLLAIGCGVSFFRRRRNRAAST